jgi:hypothetical protein
MHGVRYIRPVNGQPPDGKPHFSIYFVLTLRYLGQLELRCDNSYEERGKPRFKQAG